MPRGRPGKNGLSKTAASTSKHESTPPAPPEWVTLGQFAGELGVKPQALYWLRYRSEGPRWHRIGRELRARRQELDAWLETR